ncbi:MAG: hypothetical protein EBZ49_00250 [Proteobacteria bacterium]|nr:hypothetical protein [Pseudomonadota bacterium]
MKDLNGDSPADALLVVSIRRAHHNTYQTEFSIDGETGKPMTDEDIWKTWITLAKRLGKSKTLPDEYRALAENTFDIFHEHLDHGHCHDEVRADGVVH